MKKQKWDREKYELNMRIRKRNKIVQRRKEKKKERSKKYL